jgi:hypothetical protein
VGWPGLVAMVQSGSYFHRCRARWGQRPALFAGPSWSWCRTFNYCPTSIPQPRSSCPTVRRLPALLYAVFNGRNRFITISVLVVLEPDAKSLLDNLGFIPFAIRSCQCGLWRADLSLRVSNLNTGPSREVRQGKFPRQSHNTSILFLGLSSTHYLGRQRALVSHLIE